MADGEEGEEEEEEKRLVDLRRSSLMALPQVITHLRLYSTNSYLRIIIRE